MSKRRIVILGGGFAGVSAARRLLASGCTGEIVLVDRRDEHIFTPWLYEVATGFLFDSTRKNLLALRKTSGIPFRDFIRLQGGCDFRFRQGTVKTCDFQSRHVVLEDGHTIQYDDLVIALGSEVNFFDIPGLQSNAYTLRSLEDALTLQKDLEQLIEELRQGKRERVKVVIGGAGPTGTELAGELANMFNSATRMKKIDRTKIHIFLIEAGETVMQQTHASVRERAQHRLEHLGVRLQLHTRIETVRANEIVLVDLSQAEASRKQSYDVLVWTGGIRMNDAIKNMELEKDQRGRIVVEATMQVRGVDNVYAIGDAASYISPYSKKSLPALAQVATKQGRFVAKNIVRKEHGKASQSLRVPRDWITVTPVGGQNAVIRLFGVTISGRLGYFFRNMVDLEYFATLLPWPAFWRAWRSAERLFSQND